MKLVGLLVGGAIVFVVGLLDDVLGPRFGPGWKLAGQVLAAAVLVAAGIRTDFLVYAPLNVLFSIFWVVAITNAFNLLDNMDGLSAGVAFVASTVLLINAWLLGEVFIALLLVAFMGSLLGFLFYNWHPASIFLGDCGSLFIGFFLASLTLLQRYVSHASSHYFPILMPVLVLALPIIDTTTVVVIRLREHRPIYVGDSRHLSHRLVSFGMRPPLAVATILLLAFGLGLGATGLADADLVHATLILLQALAVVAVVLVLLFYERRTDPRSADP
jgi:UDP-GlcNAc:undecaprenyl-phosphate GlcNAc-1-phosphate transferase